ncbi:MAG: LCP family protein [Oscillospiraceae bacterium]|nr:LCP family protein [Oscillospiraceae bacterium]
MLNIKIPKWAKITGITILSIICVVALLLGALWLYIDSKLNKMNYVTDETTIALSDAVSDALEGAQTMASGEILPTLVLPNFPMDPTGPFSPTVDVSNPTGGVGETLPPDETLPTLDLPTSPQNPSQSQTESTTPVIPDSPQADIINILLIGQDRREGEGRCRSDSMILLTVNKTTKTISMTSFMRDSLVEIPGYFTYKLNHAYQFGGMSLLNDTLRKNYGVYVDGDIAVDFSQFQQLIDKLGGVDITLTEKEANFLNLGNNWNLKPGKARLTGEQALRYSRLRSIDNDYKRAGRQREVLQSLINRYMSLPVGEMVNMLDFILPLVSTNMSKNEIRDLVFDLAPLLSTCKYENYQIPAAGTFTGGYMDIGNGRKDWFQYNIDFRKNREILWEIFDAD